MSENQFRNIIIQTQNYPGVGGIENSIAQIHRILNGQGHNIRIISHGNENESTPEHAFYNSGKFPFLILPPLKGFFSFRQYVRKNREMYEKADLIICRYLHQTLATAIVIGTDKLVFIPPCISCDGYRGVIKNAWGMPSPRHLMKIVFNASCMFIDNILERKLYSTNIRVLTFSANLQRQIRKKYRPACIDTVPGGVDETRFAPLSNECRLKLRQQLGFSNDDFVVVYAGRLSAGKNPDILLKAFKALPEKNKRLVFIGEGELKKHLEQNSGADVIFTGNLNHDMLPQYYNIADVTVLPTYYESYGHVFAESLCCGTPIIGFDSEQTNTATNEFIHLEHSGLAVDCRGNRIENLSQALLHICREKEHYRATRLERAVPAQKLYRWERFVERGIFQNSSGGADEN